MKKLDTKAFSLVELIVCICIMAIMVSVLAPVLVWHVEKSRAQKDKSAASELTHAVLIAMSEQNVYDEVICYTAFGNISCYVDSQEESENPYKHITKEAYGEYKEQYLYGENDRQKDESLYYVAGNMRGMTLTFTPSPYNNKMCFNIKDAVINKYIQDESVGSDDTCSAADDRANADTIQYMHDTPDFSAYGTLGTMQNPYKGKSYLYPRLRSIVDDTIQLTSNTYRFSEYTVFIRMGSNGGNSGDMQDAVSVYGQWSGTNLRYITDWE